MGAAATYTDTKGAIYIYDPATGGQVIPDNCVSSLNPFFPSNIPVITASKAGYPANSLINMDWKNSEPRLGFAYKLFGSDKTVLRGGYEIYTNLIYSQLTASLVGGPSFGLPTVGVGRKLTRSGSATEGAEEFFLGP